MAQLKERASQSSYFALEFFRNKLSRTESSEQSSTASAYQSLAEVTNDSVGVFKFSGGIVSYPVCSYLGLACMPLAGRQ